jgi:GNAT superfamily N-acetyltransferase
MNIRKYEREDEADVFCALRKDPDWAMFTTEDAIDNYRKRLQEGVTYVCYEDGAFAGYARALLDEGIALYISELFVVPEMRGRRVGRRLIATLKRDFADLTVYALSDEDAYYEMLGYKRIGSVFEIDR